LGVVMGIALAVFASLAIVVYESRRPDVDVLTHIRGTTDYASIRQSAGTLVPNVLVARIGGSLYFANTSFLKDVLLTHVENLAEVNPTEFLVLEMTSVISVDSVAANAIADVVKDFRHRGIQVSLVIAGEGLAHELRNTRVDVVIGKDWIFPTVHEAVTTCLEHKQSQSRGVGSSQVKEPEVLEPEG